VKYIRSTAVAVLEHVMSYVLPKTRVLYSHTCMINRLRSLLHLVTAMLMSRSPLSARHSQWSLCSRCDLRVWKQHILHLIRVSVVTCYDSIAPSSQLAPSGKESSGERSLTTTAHCLTCNSTFPRANNTRRRATALRRRHDSPQPDTKRPR
jgi:hypothetical protein